jgi:L-ascorbate metabolism protein UlaG (beta-lactamase superfamily)
MSFKIGKKLNHSCKLIFCAAFGFLICCVVVFGLIIYSHSKKEKFQNSPPLPHHGFLSLLKWRWTHKPVRWPKIVELQKYPSPPRSVEGDQVRVTFINHATFLIQTQGLNILTDPIWSGRASPVSWAGPKRVCSPGVSLDDLPPIHMVLISHNHYDSLDIPTLKELWRRFQPKIYCGLKNGPLLEKNGIGNINEMNWWEELELLPKLKLICVPAQHWSSRTFFDARETLWAGFVLKNQKGSLYYSGDTGYGIFFKEIAKRMGPIKISLLPIGAYLPRWFMSPYHMSPEEAAKAHLDIGSEQSVAYHFDTFQLADEAYGQAPKDLAEALEKYKIPKEKFWVLGMGEGRTLSY